MRRIIEVSVAGEAGRMRALPRAMDGIVISEEDAWDTVTATAPDIAMVRDIRTARQRAERAPPAAGRPADDGDAASPKRPAASSPDRWRCSPTPATC